MEILISNHHYLKRYWFCQDLHVSIGDVILLLSLLHIIVFINDVILTEQAGLIRVVQPCRTQQEEVRIPLLPTNQ